MCTYKLARPYQLQCEHCEVWVHAICGNVTPEMYSLLDSDEAEQYRFFCAHCEASSKPRQADNKVREGRNAMLSKCPPSCLLARCCQSYDVLD